MPQLPPKRTAKPDWLRRRLPTGKDYEAVRSMIRQGQLHTVCQEARCPNQWECFSRRTATFLILGDRCTRDCRFCAVAHGPAGPPDDGEPVRVAAAAAELGLRYVVLTSVTRDDLPDGGAGHYALTIKALRDRIAGVRVEVLIPDFKGDEDALATVMAAAPDVLNHNLETVARCYPRVRPQAVYERSLRLLCRAHDLNPATPTKSGLMLGLGESGDEVRSALRDLRNAHCRMLTLGQYLQPTAAHIPVERYLPPAAFAAFKTEALAMGFAQVAAGPFVRSSYHAGALFAGGVENASGTSPDPSPSPERP